LENLLWWSGFTFIYNRCTIYELFHITSHRCTLTLISCSLLYF